MSKLYSNLYYSELGTTTDEYYSYTTFDYTYKLNRNGFRCDNFSDFNKEKTVIYLGGLHVFGAFLKEEECWTHQIHNKYHTDCNYANLGIIFQTPIESLDILIHALDIFDVECVYFMCPNYEKNKAWFEINRVPCSYNVLHNLSSVNNDTRKFYSDLAVKSIRAICGDKLRYLNIGKIPNLQIDVCQDNIHPGKESHKKLVEFYEKNILSPH